MLRRLKLFLVVLTFCWTTVACGGSITPQAQNPTSNPAPATSVQLTDGKYPIQQVTYDDATGEYTLTLLNTPPGTPSTLTLGNLPMARLTDAEIAAGQKSYLNVEKGQPALHLTEDFKIAYVHNVTQTQPNPQTGQPETVVVRQESSFWTPFAAAFAGQIAANLLFTPHYYMPPVYQPGGLIGYGGYGRSYNQAISSYQTRYQAPPAEVRNRQTFRQTGRFRSSPSTATYNQRNRSTGYGYGTNTMRRPTQSSPSRTRTPSFGTSSRRSYSPRRR